MSTTNQPAPALLGNMLNQINRDSFVGLDERDNLVHSLLNDAAYYLNQDYDFKTAVRTYDDEFFNLQLFNDSGNYDCLMTYYPFPDNQAWKINQCNGGEIQMKYEVFYKMLANGENDSKIKELATLVNMLICVNPNGFDEWEYTDTTFGKIFRTDLSNNTSNKLLKEEPLFSRKQDSGFVFLKQEFEFNFSFSKI